MADSPTGGSRDARGRGRGAADARDRRGTPSGSAPNRTARPGTGQAQSGRGRPATAPARPGRDGPEARPVRVQPERVPVGPRIPEDVEARELDREARAELRSLPKGAADTVARHLVAAGRLLEDDPRTALEHALAARSLAGRIAAVREAVGLAAYHSGEWQTAITELRALRRLNGTHEYLPVLADCERALGRPEKALEVAAGAPVERLAVETRMELLIVSAGARQDLGQAAAAAVTLQVPELRSRSTAPWVARLRYAYADALLAQGRTEEARSWFVAAAEADDTEATDADERLLELDGVVLTDPDLHEVEPADADADADAGSAAAKTGTDQGDRPAAGGTDAEQGA